MGSFHTTSLSLLWQRLESPLVYLYHLCIISIGYYPHLKRANFQKLRFVIRLCCGFGLIINTYHHQPNHVNLPLIRISCVLELATAIFRPGCGMLKVVIFLKALLIPSPTFFNSGFSISRLYHEQNHRSNKWLISQFIITLFAQQGWFIWCQVYSHFLGRSA